MYTEFYFVSLFSLLATAVGMVYHEGNGCGGLLTQGILNVTTNTFEGKSFAANHSYRRAVLNDSRGHCSDDTNSLQYLQLNFGKPAILTGLAIQGQPGTNNSLLKFNIQYSLGNPTNWRYYEENGDSKTFDKIPSNGDDIIEYPLYATRMDVMSITPLFWKSKICIRIEVYGCLQVDGSFSSWSSWSPCNTSCGGGKNSRSRSCSNPAPANGGRQCNGATVEYRNCTGLLCPEDGGFSSWSNWSQCGKQCESAYQARTRNCSNPPPRNNGRQCSGSWLESRSCTATGVIGEKKDERTSGTEKQQSYFLATWVLVAALSMTIIVLLVIVVVRQQTSKRWRVSKD